MPLVRSELKGSLVREEEDLTMDTIFTVDDNEPPVVELKDVGAETTKVLTIADVLTHREAQLAQQGTAVKYFDQWESISGSVRSQRLCIQWHRLLLTKRLYGQHTIQDAIDMMVESNIGSLIVTEGAFAWPRFWNLGGSELFVGFVENGGIVGIVTERDVMKKTSPRSLTEDTEKPVKDIMSAQIMCIPSFTTVIECVLSLSLLTRSSYSMGY
jgi:signal-transduction protein with cAMP-binding, CBS, and nucleotidyltransferase domain